MEKVRDCVFYVTRQGSICHDEKVAYRPFLLSGIFDSQESRTIISSPQEPGTYRHSALQAAWQTSLDNQDEQE